MSFSAGSPSVFTSGGAQAFSSAEFIDSGPPNDDDGGGGGWRPGGDGGDVSLMGRVHHPLWH